MHVPGSVIITSNSNVLSCRLARYDASLSHNDKSGKLVLKFVPHCRMQRDYPAADQRAFLQMLVVMLILLPAPITKPTPL